jgi:hypothetical protein
LKILKVPGFEFTASLKRIEKVDPQAAGSSKENRMKLILKKKLKKKFKAVAQPVIDSSSDSSSSDLTRILTLSKITGTAGLCIV